MSLDNLNIKEKNFFKVFRNILKVGSMLISLIKNNLILVDIFVLIIYDFVLFCEIRED